MKSEAVSFEPVFWRPLAALVGNLIRHRILIFDLAWRDLRARYKGSYLGFLWTFLNPMMLMGTYAVVFSFISRFDLPHYPIYVLINVVVWQFLSTSILESATAIQGAAGLVSKTSLPPEIVIAKTVLAHALNFCLALSVCLVAGALFFKVIGLYIVLLPFVMVVLVLFSLLASVVVGLLSVFFRDIQPVLANLMTVLFFASPVVYAFDHIPERARALLLLQPFAQLLRLATDVIYWNRFPSRACLTSIAMHLLVLMALAAWAILYSRGRIAEKI